MRRPRVDDLAGKRVLVTGAASGIGRATALACGAHGARLYLTDLNGEGLDATAAQLRSVGADVRACVAADLADYDQVVGMAKDFHAEAGSLDAVMNVAGISTWGTVSNLTPEQWRAQVEVNLMGPIHVIESFIPPMISAGRGGYLVNVSSAAGLVGLPWHAAYSAAKFGLRGVSEVLRFDLRRHGIGVSLVCPGAVDTPLTETVEIAGVDRTSPRARRVQRLFLRHAASPEDVARVILDAVHRGRYLVFTSRDIRVLHGLQRHAPPVYELVMDGMNRAVHRAFADTANGQS